MKVITGSARGRGLKTLQGEDSQAIRPTASRVKEAMFSAIQFDLEGAVVADLFAGSGQIGIEALSRGASFAVFADSSSEAIKIIESNVVASKFKENSEIRNAHCSAYLKSASRSFDVIFLDPPYERGHIAKNLPLALSRLNDGGIIVCEAEKELKFEEKLGNLTAKEYLYGKTKIVIYRERE